MPTKEYIASITRVFIECADCGYYHPEDFYGDCRDDSNRFSYDELPDHAEYYDLDEL